jgi:ribosomal protein S18 acetylase RimI-like enzyme
MKDIAISSYSPSDYPAVKQILLDGDNFYGQTDAEENFNRKITRNPDSILVAKKDSLIVGLIIIVEDGWIPFLFRLAVHKEYRKQGTGTLLMTEAEKRCKDKNYSEIYILVEDKNEELKHYYQNMGYKGGTPYVFMSKSLKGN